MTTKTTTIAAIETHNLQKRFGDYLAVNNLNLYVPKGSVFGFLGPNGAGKTTTLRMLTGLANPTAGDALVLGESIRNNNRSYLGKIGFLPDVPGFYDWMRPHEFLSMSGSIFGLSGKRLKSRVAETLELTGLKGVKKRIGSFSRGMKQRLGLAQALINEPELVFMDEPTSALDPLGRKEVLDTISKLAGTTTIFFSTHILNDVERVCDTVAIINKGALVTQQRIQDLRQSYSSHFIYLELENGADIDLGALYATAYGSGAAPAPGLTSGVASTPGAPGLAGLEFERYREGWRIKPSDLRAAQKSLPHFIAEQGLALRRFELIEPSLEDIFVGLVSQS
ncbi:MAG: ATP-binding cassette domain-containing protein [Bacillota bacterium]|jgi:ABC-2 type transport system ATP-binding protein